MDTSSKVILVVDDEPSHRMLMRRALKGFPGFTILEADSLLKATSILNRELDRLALAIIDFNLAGHSGIEVVDLVRSFRRFDELPILIASTSNLDSDIDAGYSAGANCFLIKTSDPAVFSGEIQAAVKFLLRGSLSS